MARLQMDTLLRLHRGAYALLLHLDQKGASEPQWLSRQVASLLSRSQTALLWLAEHRDAFPEKIRPERGYEEPFARLFASLFDVSFAIDSGESDVELLSARLHRGIHRTATDWRSTSAVTALALRHVLACECIRLDIGLARRLARDSSIRTEARIVTYAWELERRAIGKSKGPIVHSLWMSLSADTRRTLDGQRAWLAREAVCRAAVKLLVGRECVA